MGRSKYSNVLTIILIIAIIVIIVISTIVAIQIYKSHKEDQKRKQAIAEFVTNIENTNFSNSSYETNNITNDNIIINTIETNIVTNGNTAGNNTTKPKKVKFYANTEFVMIGYIEIPKTGINYPILIDTSAEALDTAVGVLYPTNPTLNEPGNVVIIGHNYRNGKFFSNNKKLSVGDKINITDESGKKMSYTIYEIFETTSTDTKYITRDTGDNIEISLSTCTDDGSKRLIILAKVQ